MPYRANHSFIMSDGFTIATCQFVGQLFLAIAFKRHGQRKEAASQAFFDILLAILRGHDRRSHRL